jgi:hypothetical protein
MSRFDYSKKTFLVLSCFLLFTTFRCLSPLPFLCENIVRIESKMEKAVSIIDAKKDKSNLMTQKGSGRC